MAPGPRLGIVAATNRPAWTYDHAEDPEVSHVDYVDEAVRFVAATMPKMPVPMGMRIFRKPSVSTMTSRDLPISLLRLAL